MCDFTTAAPCQTSLNPDQRVAYSLGLVLGQDEMEQEAYYFLEQGRLHHRGLHGYGTFCGLQVVTQDSRVTVKSGLALNPQGKLLRVPRDQCADLDDWLQVAVHREALGGTPGAPVRPASLY